MSGLCGLVIRSEGWPILDAGAAEAFIEAPDPGVIFLRGMAVQEAGGIAVTLRELRREMVGLLRIGVATEAAEPVVQRRLGLAFTPSVAFVGGGHVLARLEGLRYWNDYTGATDAALAMLSSRSDSNQINKLRKNLLF
jgi:hypothetical protein